ncbi:MAG: hypothetical protein K6A43_07020 [Treponema sp.]|nr:hypothetical protein [Treponema sp.]
MLQFYFLSILFNLVAGLILVNKIDESSEKGLAIADSSSDSEQTAQSKKKAKSKQNEVQAEVQNAESSAETAASGASDKFSTAKKLQDEFRKTSLFESKTFRLVLGILTGLTGLLKLFSAIRGDVPVVGDLLPALAGLAGSFCLLLDYYINAATIEVTISDTIKKIFIKNSNIIGFAMILVAVIHFIFPTVLFL